MKDAEMCMKLKPAKEIKIMTKKLQVITVISND